MGFGLRLLSSLLATPYLMSVFTARASILLLLSQPEASATSNSEASSSNAFDGALLALLLQQLAVKTSHSYYSTQRVLCLRYNRMRLYRREAADIMIS